MMRNVNSFVSILIVVSLLLSAISCFSVGAASYGDLSYTVLNDEVAITSCDTFAKGSIRIPSEIEGYPVTRIYGDAFINCTKVTHVYIPSTVAKIEPGALSLIVNLEGIYVDEYNQNYCSEKGVLFNKDKTSLLCAPRTLTEYTIPSSVIQIGISAFDGCKALCNVTIGDNVTSIGSSAFYECTSLVSITIPDSVKTIEGCAFYRCTSLSNVEFGNSVANIGDYAFSYCRALTTISLPDSVTDINAAFSQCTGLSSIDIGGVKTLDYRAFWGCSKLSSITIGSSLTWISSSAFEGCESLLNVYYYGTEEQWEKVGNKDGNYYLRERATVHYVHDCQWDEGMITREPSCMPGIKTYTCTWSGCSKTMTESIEKITDHTYGLWRSIDSENHQRTCDCGYADIEEHNWDKAVCTEVRTCTVCGESSQGHVWTEATCAAPKTCTICNSTEGNPVHNVVGEICSICNRYGTCGINLIWSLDENGVLIISGTGEMSDYKYNTFPWYMVRSSVKELVVDSGVTSIGECAFYDCVELRCVFLPATVTSIGENAFYYCRQLTNLNLSNGLTTVGDNAFRYCTSITSIRLPDSVAYIGNYAFSYCLALESISVPDAVTVINQSTFRDSKNLKNVTIGKGVTKIMSSAFSGCNSLESINIPLAVTSIKSSAFDKCDKLSTVIYCGTTTQWEAIQFIEDNNVLLNCQRIQHAWIDATCTTPETCTFCGVINGTALGHTWADATCTAPPTCIDCGETVGVLLPHNFGQTIIHQPAPGIQGYSEHTCIDCGYIEKFDFVNAIGVCVSGDVTSFLEGRLTVELVQDSKVVYSAVVSGDSYTIADVVAGTYTLRVSKDNHVTREYEVIVIQDITVNTEIYPMGDINNDGKVNMKDWNRLYEHLNEVNELTGYEWLCADVTGEGKVNMKDWNRLYEHLTEVNPLW